MPKPPELRQIPMSGRSTDRSTEHVWRAKNGLKHRKDGPAWVFSLFGESVLRWCQHGVEIMEVHPMTDMYPPQIWVRKQGG